MSEKEMTEKELVKELEKSQKEYDKALEELYEPGVSDEARLTSQEWNDILLSLEDHHVLFYRIWEMGRPIFTDSIPTAAVSFDQTGDYVNFLFNPKFWNSLDDYNKQFVIAHEALHIILNHGRRITDAEDRAAANRAIDIVVNESLVRDFGFDRSRIRKQHELCWVDTIFKNRKPLPPDDETYEYYINLFEKVYMRGKSGKGKGKPQQGQGGGKGDQQGQGGDQDDENLPGKTVDDHSGLAGEQQDAGSPVDPGDACDKIIDKVNEQTSTEEKEDIKKFLDKHGKSPVGTQAGTGTGGQWTFVKVAKKPKKKKWETVIKKWSRKYLLEDCKEEEQWVRLNRRLTALPTNIFIPSEMEIDEISDEKTKIQVYFFLDTSGSCIGLADRFFTAATTLPKHRFDIRLFCFDTKVEETTLASKRVYGGGGTSFSCIEEFIQRDIKKNNKGKYPEGVWILSDGMGDRVKPQFPKKWKWFIVKGCMQYAKQYAPANCGFYNLEDFE